MSNFFTRRLRHSSPPWRIQDPGRGIIYNQQDQRIATVPKAGDIDWQTRTANLNVIAHAPELLEALIVATALLHQQGMPPSAATVDLLNRCRPGAPPIPHANVWPDATPPNDDDTP